MNTSTLQLLSLISYGIEYINQGKPEPGYFPQNPVFRFCKHISFKTTKKSWLGKENEIKAGNDPLEWFHYLKQNDCRDLKAIYQSSKFNEKYRDRNLAGFVGGGGNWMIETVYEKHSDFWYADWSVGDKADPEEKIWHIEYRAILKKEKIINMQFALHEVKDDLRNTLNEIMGFAYKHGYDNFGECFKRALEALASEYPFKDFYAPDFILKKNYQLPAQQLLAAACTSWVFGGMGSWNDMGFSEPADQEKYDALSERLYELIIIALIAGINSY